MFVLENVRSNNILCSKYDEMNVFSGNWTFDNNTCSLQQSAELTGFGSIIWFGSADGGTPDADYSYQSFIVETSLSISSGDHNAGIIFRAAALSSSQFYYFAIWPYANRIKLWLCCWVEIFDASQTINHNETYDLKILANGNYFNFSVNDVVVYENLKIIDAIISGSVGLQSYNTVTRFYSFNYTMTTTGKQVFLNILKFCL